MDKLKIKIINQSYLSVIKKYMSVDSKTKRSSIRYFKNMWASFLHVLRIIDIFLSDKRKPLKHDFFEKTEVKNNRKNIGV